MPGLSLRDLLCCCPQSSDNATHPNSPITPEGRLDDEKTTGDGDGVSNVEGSAGAKANGDGGAPGGSARAGVASEESSKTPAATQGTSIVVAGDEKGSVQRMKDWFNDKIDEGGLGTALKITNSALGQAKDITGILSVPGAELTIGIVLFIISNVQTSIKNNKTFEDLREFLSSLSSIILVPLTQSDVSKTGMVYQSVESFLQEIIKHSRKLVDLEPSSGVIRFLKAKFIEGELSEFSRGIQEAITNFQMGLNIGNAVVLEKLDKALEDMKRQINSMVYKMDSKRMEEQLEKLLQQEVSKASSEYQQDIKSCHGNTCEAILSEVKDWAMNVKFNQGQVFWLRGRAGTGKSTIAKTIGKWAGKEGILGSKYFFARDVGGNAKLSKSLYLFPKIAYDIARFDTSMKETVSRVVEEISDVFEDDIEEQFQTLIAEPLARLSKDTGHPRKLMLLIIDSLDECDKQEDVEDIIRLVLNLLTSSNPHIRVLITSRPEKHIQGAFGNVAHQPIIRHRELEDSLNPDDVGNYLYDGMHKRYPETGWWESEAFKSLVEYSGNLFIYASTALRYICAGNLGEPEERITDLLNLDGGAAPGDSRHEQLDRLYLGILKRVIGITNDSRAVERLQRILGTIMQLNDSLSVSALEELVTTDELPITNLGGKLEGLSSVIVVPPPDELFARVHFFHQSFPDFLKEKQRCTETFLIDIAKIDSFLSSRCLEVMIAGLQDNSRTPSSALWYACTNWSEHLAKARQKDKQVRDNFEKFVRCHLREWFGVMKSLLSSQSMHSLVSPFEVAREWVKAAQELELVKAAQEVDLEGVKTAQEWAIGFKDYLSATIRTHFRSIIDEELPQVAGAPYDSVRSTGRIEACHPGTRSAVLKKVKGWARNMDSTTRSIFWLCESGGTGKSAVAMSVAQWAAEVNILGGSFFFDKQAPQCDLQSFISTIAHDLALFDPSRMKSIAQAIDNHSSSSRYNSDSILASLLPVLDLQVPIVLIVDALDECQEVMAEEIIGLLSTLSESNPHLRIFVTSRPESHIEDAFQQEDEDSFDRHNVNADNLDDVDSDEIKAYVCAELSKIHSDVDWRKRGDFEALLKYCGDLFIHISTALRYIAGRNKDCNVCIVDVLRLNKNTPPSKDPYERLTRFYLAILNDLGGDESDLNREEAEQLRTIIGMVSELRETLPINALSELFKMDDSSDLRNILNGLKCVIAIPSPNEADTPVRFFHRSFSDFMKDQQGASSDWRYLGVRDLEARLAQNCLDVMIKGLSGNTSKTFTAGLQYAYKYWADHLANARYGDAQVMKSLESFVFRRFLLKWLSVDPADLDFLSSSLRKAHWWTIKSRSAGDLSGIINGVSAFVALEGRVHYCSDELGSHWPDFRRAKIGVCYDGTCKAILSKIKDWATAADGQSKMFWLRGLSGSGKSTIAMAIACWAKHEGLLGYSNFPLIAKGSYNDSGKVPYLILHHIAYRISKFDSSLTESVMRALIDVDVLYQGAAAHYQAEDPAADLLDSNSKHNSQLIRKPLLLVIDALDEFRDPTTLGTIIRFLMVLSTLNPHIRIFISSRPEQHIQTAFDQEVNQLTSTNMHHECVVEDFVENSDIEEYLRYDSDLTGFGQPDQPSEDNIRLLAAKSKALFVYASTASRFILRGITRTSESPKERLQRILKIESKATKDKPYTHLDNLYLCILNESIGEDEQADATWSERLRKVLGAMILFHEPQPIDCLAKIIGEDQERTETMVKYLGARGIIRAGEPERRYPQPRFHDLCLPDFLTTIERCVNKRFFIDVATMGAYLFQRILDIIAEGFAATSREMTDGLNEALSYACKHWAHHLEQTQCKETQAAEKLCHFFRHNFYRWLNFADPKEFQNGDDLHFAMEVAHNWAATAGCDEATFRALNDMERYSESMHTIFAGTVPSILTYDRAKYWQSSCLPETRVDILSRLKKWTTKLDATATNIIWLSGLPLSGKTSVAMSIADWANEKGILGGALFPSSWRCEGLKVCNVFSAIVQEIASFHASFRDAVVEALERDGSLGFLGHSMNGELEDQFKELVEQPLRLAKLNSPILLIIDVLDKCQKEEAAQVLKLFLTRLSGPEYSHIRILVSSRPEPHICNTFKQYGHHETFDIDTKTPSLAAQQDIRKYLHERLSQVHEKCGLSRPNDWPDPHDLNSLVNNSGGLFCYAEQAVSFIRGGTLSNRDPDKRLRDWLDHQPESYSYESHGMKYFYRDGCRRAIVTGIAYKGMVHALAAIVLSKEPLVLETHVHLLQIDKSILRTFFRSIHPIVIWPNDPQAPLRPFHPSLRSFLTNSYQFRELDLRRFFVDVPKQEAYLCQRCLDIIAEGVSRDSDEGTSEGGENLSLDNMGVKEDAGFSPILRYACVYWAAHLSEADSKNSLLKESMEKFLRKHLLIWMEAMSHLQMTEKIVPSLQSASVYARKGGPISKSQEFYFSEGLQPKPGFEEDSNLHDLLRDSIHFAENNRDAFAESPSLVYRTLLDFSEGLLRRTYEKPAKERLSAIEGPKRTGDAARTPRSLWFKAKSGVLSGGRGVARFVEDMQVK